MRISAEQMLSSKLVTSSNFWPFMLIFARMLFVLLVMSLLFSMLTSISRVLALSTSLSEVLKFTIAAAKEIDVVGES